MAVTSGFLADELGRRLPSSGATLVARSLTTAGDGLLSNATHDSQRTGELLERMLFCCVRGLRVDGHAYASDAVAGGARALLVDHVLDLEVDQVVVENVREAMGYAASIVHGDPGRTMRMVAITGTNGKTTTAHMLEAILLAAGRRPAVLGTLTQTRTTPEATDLHARLADFRDQGRTDVVMEVTSHALDLHRIDGCHFAVGVFTNLSQDHLDYHGTMERYFTAKAKLFVPGFIDHAVVNRDDLHGRLLSDAALVPTTEIRLTDAEDLELRPNGSTFSWNGVSIRLPLAGAFNVRNALGAAVVARVLGISDDAIVRGLGAAVVPGRYEPIREGQQFAVVVDFAHTPDGLLNVLSAARSSLSPSGRLLTVFGCGGDRDRGKRPQMGSLAAMYSDLTVVTSDNPRSEDPHSIVDEIVAGIEDPTNVTTILDRREAIRWAIAQAKSDDIVLIAGKGHETGQERDGVVTPFDDRNEAREALRLLRGTQP